MRVGRQGTHLGYCTNIHPGETWPEIRSNVENHVRDVKRQISPDRPLGIGLRLSGAAARTLRDPATLAAFRAFLEQNDLYVFTINAFPYGPFHGRAVKEAVYRPDWLEPERLRYSEDVAVKSTRNATVNPMKRRVSGDAARTAAGNGTDVELVGTEGT